MGATIALLLYTSGVLFHMEWCIDSSDLLLSHL